MENERVRYRWRYYCEIRKKMITTKTALPEELIKWEHPDAVPVPGTMEVTPLADDPFAMCLSNILRDYKPPFEVGPLVKLSELAKKKPPTKDG